MTLFEIITASLSAVAIVVSVVAIRQNKAGNKSAASSAASSARSADASDRSADASARSADAAEQTVRQAAELNRIERERDHEERRPWKSAEIEAVLEPDSRVKGQRHLRGSITVSRDCRVQAVGKSGNMSTPVGLPMLLKAGRAHRIDIEAWPPDKDSADDQGDRVQVLAAGRAGPGARLGGLDMLVRPAERVW